MVDVIKSLGVPYVCGNPGSSFRGLQESIVTYGGNEQPEFLTCLHEESAVAMAHGYAKIEGKPLIVLAHGTVGLQHASMAIYNAWCDRVPVYIILGNTLDAIMRYPGVEWVHSVQDAAAMVRDYVKWDDTPISLQHFAESAVRAYKVSMTPWAGPVVLVADAELQERPIPEHGQLRVPKLTLAAPPQADSGAVAELARFLVDAASPVLIADRAARSQAGMERLVELAELVQAAVVSTLPNTMPPIGPGRMNFPSRHPLNQTLRSAAAIADGDVVVGLEIANFFGATNTYRDQIERSSRAATKTGAKLVTVSAGELSSKANYQDFQRYSEVDLALAGDVEATLPSLIEAVKRLITDDRKRAFAARGVRLADASRAARERARIDATYAWDAVPISTARLAAEVWAQVRQEDWSLVNGALSGWAQRLWNFEKYYQVHRRVGRIGNRLRSAGGRWRRACEPAVRPALNQPPERRRSHVCARRPLDGGPLQDSDSVRHEQQPRVSRGSHAPAAHGQPARARHRTRAHRQRHQRSRNRLREARAEPGRARGRPDCQSRRSRAGDQPGHRDREERRTGADRCDHAASVTLTGHRAVGNGNRE